MSFFEKPNNGAEDDRNSRLSRRSFLRKTGKIVAGATGLAFGISGKSAEAAPGEPPKESSIDAGQIIAIETLKRKYRPLQEKEGMPIEERRKILDSIREELERNSIDAEVFIKEAGIETWKERILRKTRESFASFIRDAGSASNKESLIKGFYGSLKIQEIHISDLKLIESNEDIDRLFPLDAQFKKICYFFRQRNTEIFRVVVFKTAAADYLASGPERSGNRFDAMRVLDTYYDVKRGNELRDIESIESLIQAMSIFQQIFYGREYSEVMDLDSPLHTPLVKYLESFE